MRSIKRIYENQYKKLLIIPFLILLLAIIQISVQYSTTGDFVHKGISLKGGSTITFDYNPSLDISAIEQSLEQQFPTLDVTMRTLSSGNTITSVAVDSGAQETADIDALTTAIEKEAGIKSGDYSVEVVGSALGDSFFRQLVLSLIVAFLLMGTVVFFYFRAIAPSMAVILAAFSDIVVTLAVFNLTGMKLGSAGIAAFLMLIGYSVDTDILLSTRVLKRRDESVMQRVYSAMKTGATMTSTTLVAVLIAFFFVQSDIVKQIMLILFIGLVVDIIMTWIQNVGILRIYLERKQK
ncbi:hypothetical protein COV20_04580 [Candidatus Woesearchaeota archaeon CG10_big_fil_rev_8_21_14_0_10_45_16]|nr:MAG: hypothetical protein COV20_04580 [Candidatus Woesearchaeota archaeon CG10_big_fil_rev_8_21_14_0_10_45_16]